MGRKKKNPMIADSKLTNCSVVVEILDEVFIPRYEPGFDCNWGNYSWHVATVKIDGLPSEDDEETPDDTTTENCSKIEKISQNENSCDICNFKSTTLKSLKRHILTAHGVSSENEGDSIDESEFTGNNDGERYTDIKDKLSDTKKLVQNKKVKTKTSSCNKSSMINKDKNENTEVVSAGLKVISDSNVIKSERHVLNVQNSLDKERSPYFNTTKVAVKKRLKNSVNSPKKISYSRLGVTKGKLINPFDINKVKNIKSNEIEVWKNSTVSSAKDCDSVKTIKSALISQNGASKSISFDTNCDGQTKKRMMDDSIKRTITSLKEETTVSSKRKKININPIETEKLISNDPKSKTNSTSSGYTNKTLHSLLKKNKSLTITTNRMASICEKPVRNSQINLADAMKFTIPKLTANKKSLNLNTNQTEKDMSNCNTVDRGKNKTHTSIPKIMKPDKIKKEKDILTASESIDDDTIYYSLNSIEGKPQNDSGTESKSFVSKNKILNSSCIETEESNMSNSKCNISFKEAPSEEFGSTSNAPRIPRNLSYPLACLYCQFRCKNDWVMQKHTLTVHNNGIHFICKLCGYKTKVLGSFQMHHLVHSKVKSLSCDQCNYKTNFKANLNHHKKCHSDLRPFKCDQCNYTCKRKNSLKSHVLLHTDVKPYSCNHCNFKCKLPEVLKIHQMRHSKVKPFKCGSCNYACNFTNNLKRHMFVHTSDRPFKCDSCNKTFKTKPLLKNHALIHTYEKPYICEKCDIEFNTVQNLKKHLKSHSV